MSHITGIIPAQLIRSDKDTHFTTGLTTNAGEDENLTGLRQNLGLVEAVTVQSDQNLDWDVYFFTKDTFDDTNIDDDTFIGMVKFVAADGAQIGGANQYYYSTVNSSYSFRAFEYVDEDRTKEMHVKVVNRNAVAKNAGATGEVTVCVTFRPEQV